MLANDGDFLVRQSSGDSEQYVLSGRQNGIIKHLLLVDPEGVVSSVNLFTNISDFTTAGDWDCVAAV